MKAYGYTRLEMAGCGRRGGCCRLFSKLRRCRHLIDRVKRKRARREGRLAVSSQSQSASVE